MAYQPPERDKLPPEQLSPNRQRQLKRNKEQDGRLMQIFVPNAVYGSLERIQQKYGFGTIKDAVLVVLTRYADVELGLTLHVTTKVAL